jgi:signal transduction histidine kinase
VLHQVAAGRGALVDTPDHLEVGVPAEVVAGVLAPLIDNALEHARSSVRLRAEPVGDAILVHVLDDGPGFRGEDLDRAFSPGYSRTRGHGLGLAVVRRIAMAAGVDVHAVADGRGHVEVHFPRA